MGLVQDNDWKGPKKTSASVFLTPNLRLRLTDPGKIPVKNGKCRIAGNPGRIYPCDANGIVEIPVSDWNEKTIELEWEGQEAEARAASERFPWSNTFDLDIRSAEDAYCGKRLTHLGFYGGSLSEQVMEYQNHFGLAASGDLKHIQEALVHWHDGGPIPSGGPGGGGSADTMMPPADEMKGDKATRRLYITQHDDHDWTRTHAAIGKHRNYRLIDKPEAEKSDILDAMEMARPGDIFVFEGHSYTSKLGGPVMGILGDGSVKIKLQEIQSSLTGSPPGVAIFAACNSSEILPAARAAGVRLVFGIENVIRDNVVHPISMEIADMITAYLINGDTITEAMEKVNYWCEHADKNDGNRLTSESADDVDIDLNLEDNRL